MLVLISQRPFLQREPKSVRLEKRDPTIAPTRAYALSSQKNKLPEFGRNRGIVRRNPVPSPYPRLRQIIAGLAR